MHNSILSFTRMCDSKGETAIRDRIYHLSDEKQTKIDPDCMNKGYRFTRTIYYSFIETRPPEITSKQPQKQLQIFFFQWNEQI